MTAFTVNQADLAFILRQIKVAEAHAAGTPLTQIYVDAAGNVVSASTPGAVLAIPDPHVPVGLRTVDGSYNNVVPGRELWGAADQTMPRLLNGKYGNDADGDEFDNNGPGPGGLQTNTNYGNSGHVVDADPRIISNLIVDMSVNNPAAIAAWFANPLAVAAWEEANPGKTPVAPGTVLGVNDKVLTNADLAAIPNISADEGLTAPFNAWMTFFGQFFDHGLDLITKGGSGTVYIPLQADDPLITHGPDGVPNTGDEVGPSQRFMVLTRATDVNGAAAGNDARNTTTPFVDQNQTYTSHASHQVFLREYATVAGKTVSTGLLLNGANDGLPTWADIKEQARTMLGIQLDDRDVLNIPLLRTDAYGEFIPDPVTGYAQLILGIGADGIPNTADDIVVSGTRDAPISTFGSFTVGSSTFTGAVRIGHAFLDDIADSAAPVISGGNLVPDADLIAGNAIPRNAQGQKLAYDNELLDRHFVTGDGRGNENIGLTTVHHIFHSEHNRQVEAQKLTILQSGNLDFVNEWLATDLPTGTVLPTTVAGAQALAATLNWDGERLFQAARFATEMQYQHLVFEEFARKIQPNIDPFVFNNATDINPAIFAEFANTVYRFGHSMLTDNMPRIDENGNVFDSDISLVEAFLNPISFDHQNDGDPLNDLTADQAAASIVRGMTIERGNEIDEFIVSSLRNNLLGLPLDLAAINIARGRETGVPTLNDARQQLYAATGSTFLKPYDHWVDFAANLKNPASVINFIAAYGKHSSIPQNGTLQEKRDAATLLVMGDTDLDGSGTIDADEIAPADRIAFLTSTGAWTAANSGLNDIDLWIGGLAEKKMPFGGMLGSTFNAVFEAQLENLQDGDRFYYLTRTQGQNLLVSLEQNSFAKLIMANTDLAQPGPDGIRGTADDIVPRHIGVDAFAAYDYVLEVNAANQVDYNGAATAGVDPIGDNPIFEAIGLGKVIRNDPGTVGPDANYIRFTGGEHVVIGGTSGNDTIIADFGDDGIWGDAGDDRIEAGAGVDLVNGGAGNDIITDSGDSGDFLKGDEGDDVIANSNGLDIIMGGSGKDVIFVGVDDTEVFAGQGDDFVLGGDGVDLIMGNEGDDWLEGGAGFDTTAGDNSELFFNSTIIGHDVMFAGTDEHDFDAESGDDIMVQGESVIRNEGMFGFDWAIFKGLNIDGYADMNIPIFTTEQADILRNRFDKVEALSGWNRNDTLIGDSRVFGEIGPGDITATTEGVFFRDGLDQAGIDRISGLDQIVGVDSTGFFERGNILLGGGGSDILKGNGGDDILDGDRWLNVRIRITGAGQENTAANQIGTVDSLKHVFANDSSVPAAWRGHSLFELMISRTIVPNQLHIVREVLDAGSVGATDVAVYNDVRANYAISANADGSIRVEHVTVTAGAIDPTTGRNIVSDGIDTLRNIEQLKFSDQTITLSPPQLKLDAYNPGGTYVDNFTTANYGNTNGTLNWGPDWTETGDDNSATAAAGQIRITGGSLQFDAGDGASISRQVNLSAASSARLTYEVDETGFDAGETVTVEFSPNGVAPFTLLETINSGTNSVNRGFDLQGPFTANAVLRFTVSGVNGAGEFVDIDNVAFNLTVPNPAPTVNYATTFTENGAAAAIASGPSIVDDAALMASARIVLTNASAGDQLLVGTLPAGITSAVDTTVAGLITVTLTGAASQAAYQAAIQAVSFNNTSQTPLAGNRIINVTVNDGVMNSNVATTTVNVISVNDVPVANNDALVTNIVDGSGIVVPKWVLLANDTDLDGNTLNVTAVTENQTDFSVALSATAVTVTHTTAANRTFTYTASDGIASDTATVSVTRDTNDIATGNGSQILVGNNAASAFNAGAGNDYIFAGGGNDTITQNAADGGRDFIDGGAETTAAGDRFILNGTNVAEVFRVYAKADAVAAGIYSAAGLAEILITRNTNGVAGPVTAANIVAELTDIEEIVINTAGGADQVIPIGDFNPTSLNFNTITVNGGAGNDTVDVSGLQSAHRILFRSFGGNDTIIGNLRPQDVIELAPGENTATYTLVNNGNGTQTYSNGTNSITFTGAVPPQFQDTSPPTGNENGVTGAFEYTPGDLAGLKALVNGLQPNGGDDEVPTGVRNLSGHGNNVANPTWGSADEPFIRITNPHYGAPDANGNLSINPIFAGLDPRNISNILGAQEAGLPHAGNDANIFFMAMGQYIDHGLDFLGKGGNGTIQIGAPGNGAPGSGNPADLTRGTVVGYEADGTPLHINHTSPFVDQNQAYGSNDLVGQFLREGDGQGGTGSHLLAGAPDPSNPDFNLLPTLRELIQHHWANNTVFHSPSLDGGSVSFQTYYAGLVSSAGVINTAMLPSMISSFMGTGHALLLDTNPYISPLDHYVAGDGRANENFALTAIHTVWARNHNHHVEGLEAAGFQGTAEELFQAAKIINEAEYQRVVFTEYADALLGACGALQAEEPMASMAMIRPSIPASRMNSPAPCSGSVTR
ncbi:calcium-binding protein [Tardiphaga alba]|uniref:Calcium-binding protein n=1 Tax=Tardiphaga alba TaxID=340268 RepID=A0ABX8A4N8_9BRAD|nr:calcium-binding protein [Tardiphaga alba]